MIDVLKRLAELDSQNPNIVKENLGLDECGPMGMMGGMAGMDKPSTPATINITAGSGEELSDMLGAIMKLAGVHSVEPHHMGMEPEPMTLTAEPVAAVGPAASAGDEMRSVIDKMHDAGGDDDEEGEEDDEEETDEGMDQYGIPGVATTPKSPHAHKEFEANQFANQENQPGAGDHMDGSMPKGITTFEGLMAEYREFVNESQKKKSELNERMGEAEPIILKFEDGKTARDYIVDGDVTSMMTNQQLIQHFSEKYKKPVVGITMDTKPTPYRELTGRVHHEPYEDPSLPDRYAHRTGADTPYI